MDSIQMERQHLSDIRHEQADSVGLADGALALLRHPLVKDVFDWCAVAPPYNEDRGLDRNLQVINFLEERSKNALEAAKTILSEDAASSDSIKEAEVLAGIGMIFHNTSRIIREKGTVKPVIESLLAYAEQSEVSEDEPELLTAEYIPFSEEEPDDEINQAFEPDLGTDLPIFSAEQETDDELAETAKFEALENPFIQMVVESCEELTDLQEASTYVESQAWEIVSCLNRYYESLNPIKKQQTIEEFGEESIEELVADIKLYSEIHHSLMCLIEDFSDESVADVSDALLKFNSRYEEPVEDIYQEDDDMGIPETFSEEESPVIPDREQNNINVFPHRSGVNATDNKDLPFLWYRSDAAPKSATETIKEDGAADTTLSVIEQDVENPTTGSTRTVLTRKDAKMIADALRGTESYLPDGGAQNLVFKVPGARLMATDEHLDAAKKVLADLVQQTKSAIERAKTGGSLDSRIPLTSSILRKHASGSVRVSTVGNKE